MKIYLAGPDVFLPDAVAIGQRKRAICQRHGVTGLYPLDNTVDLTAPDASLQIFRANEAMMEEAHAVIANLTPFRGVSMDAGTAFEVGFMRALGRPVAGYTNARDDYRDRSHAFRIGTTHHFDADRPHIEVEDFGLAENLMIEIAIAESGCSVVRNQVAAAVQMTDLTGLRRSLAELAKVLGVP